MSRRLPEDPLIRQLIAGARRAQLSRRSLMTAGGLGAAALTLSACAQGGNEPPKPAEDKSDSDKRLVWANWPGYMDEDDEGNYPTLERFIEQTGIDVTYNVDVDDNNTYYAKVRDQLALGQDIGADTVCLTEWMVARLVRLGYVQELEHDNIPNIKNLTPSLADPDFDPGRKKSLPWQGGFAGIAWNVDELPQGLASVSDLWAPELKGRVGVLSEMRDTIGVIMLDEGLDITDFDDADFEKGLDVFREHVESGQIRNVKGNAYLEDLANGDTLAAICWSGDITTLNAEEGREKWKFAIPAAGGTIWNDTFVVPIGSTRKTNAETLMNYYYEPEVAAEVAAWVNYVTPVVGAKEAAAAIDPALAENQLIFPDDETLSTVHAFRTLTSAEEQKYGSDFQSVLLGA
ncbi:spermidine/putrescine transport system substrate-binding protein [Diaminobutyricimonas aerilata]|uniref:Spermidine/putrescine transport system substrate-binding protein n=1 Tax=Diaminobutyricimonas aerilata TaxID=1162967 RepID=A0A2M9CLD2_9MICO|nr:extracellular solute-binding protein [Diaminobutyricimonas aerilata]PJJ72701.1 spermidine/putrescine transport system substrate-binding protein [Diaminobutyricimonas aerilata]